MTRSLLCIGSFRVEDVERAAHALLCADHPEACGWSGKPVEVKDHYRKLARAALEAVAIEPCGCAETCGDDGDIDGPGTCKGLPRAPEAPLVEIVMVRR